MEFLSTVVGKLKIATVVCGLCALAIMASIFDKYIQRDKEKTFFAFIIIAFILSLLVLVVSSLKLNQSVNHWKTIDAGLHAVLGVLLAVGWILYVIRISDIDEIYRKGYLTRPPNQKRLLAKASFVLIFEAINIPLYFTIAFLVLRKP